MPQFFDIDDTLPVPAGAASGPTLESGKTYDPVAQPAKDVS